MTNNDEKSTNTLTITAHDTEHTFSLGRSTPSKLAGAGPNLAFHQPMARITVSDRGNKQLVIKSLKLFSPVMGKPLSVSELIDLLIKVQVAGQSDEVESTP